jgi:hypothetical protein
MRTVLSRNPLPIENPILRTASSAVALAHFGCGNLHFQFSLLMSFRLVAAGDEQLPAICGEVPLPVQPA